MRCAYCALQNWIERRELDLAPAIRRSLSAGKFTSPWTMLACNFQPSINCPRLRPSSQSRTFVTLPVHRSYFWPFRRSVPGLPGAPWRRRPKARCTGTIGLPRPGRRAYRRRTPRTRLYAAAIAEHPRLRQAVRLTLWPVVYSAKGLLWVSVHPLAGLMLAFVLGGLQSSVRRRRRMREVWGD